MCIKKKNEVVDICKIIEKCSIDEISKYLLEKGKKRNFRYNNTSIDYEKN